MGGCASKPKTKDDNPKLKGGEAPETPRPKKNIHGSSGLSAAYIHATPRSNPTEPVGSREAELNRLLLAANPADFEVPRVEEKQLIERIIEEETCSSYSTSSTNGQLSAREIQLRKEQINTLHELECHLEEDIQSLTSRGQNREVSTPSRLKHRFLVDAESLEFPMSPRHGETVAYQSPNFTVKFNQAPSIESLKLYAPERDDSDSGNAIGDEDSETQSESSLTESMQAKEKFDAYSAALEVWKEFEGIELHCKTWQQDAECRLQRIGLPATDIRMLDEQLLEARTARQDADGHKESD